MANPFILKLMLVVTAQFILIFLIIIYFVLTLVFIIILITIDLMFIHITTNFMFALTKLMRVALFINLIITMLVVIHKRNNSNLNYWNGFFLNNKMDKWEELLFYKKLSLLILHSI